jgi:transposase
VVTARLSSPKSDGSGTSLAIEVTAGQVHESTRAESFIGQAIALVIGRRRQTRRRRHKPRQLTRDKAYSVQRLRDWLGEQNIEPVIPHKENEHARHDPTVWFDRWAYRGPCVAEQCVGWLKEFRRIGTRFEKLAVNFHGMLQLAMINRYLRLLFQTVPSISGLRLGSTSSHPGHRIASLLRGSNIHLTTTAGYRNEQKTNHSAKPNVSSALGSKSSTEG